MSITPDELDAFRDNFKFIGEELAALKGGDVGAELKRERQALSRERNMAAQERTLSSNEASSLADRLNAARTGYEDQLVALDAGFTELNEALDTRAKSVRNGQLLMQTALADAQAEIAAGKAELSEVSVERLQLRESLGPLRAEIQLVKDELHGSKRPLRELAMEAVASADKADLDGRVGEAVELAIRRGIENGLLAPGPALKPAELQPKPERPAAKRD